MWTDEELEILRQMWGECSRAEISEALPNRSWNSIRLKAAEQKLGDSTEHKRNKRNAEKKREKRKKRREKKRARARTNAEILDEAKAKSKLGDPLTQREADLIAAENKRLARELDQLRAHAPKERKYTRIHSHARSSTVEIGIISCTHLGSRAEQLTALNAYYDEIAERGISTVLHCGDLVDGDAHRRPDTLYGQHTHSATGQREYAIRAYPRRDGVTTHVNTGNHDEWWQSSSGYNIVAAIAERRPDIKYEGRWVADYVLDGGLRVRMRHGTGGMSYARSYKLQKAMEQCPRDQADSPHLLAIGHYHQTCWLPRYQGASCLLLGAFQGRTSYVKSFAEKDELTNSGFIVSYSLNGFSGDVMPESITAEVKFYRELKNDWNIFQP